MGITESIILILLLSPLVGCLIAGLFGKILGKACTSVITISLVGVSLLLAVYCMLELAYYHPEISSYNIHAYEWAFVSTIHFNIGFLVDRIAAYMMIVVTFVSFLVHIYSIGYMKEDPGYTRFFCYISGFTFAMLALVLANNFLLLYFGWEAVGLVSYLLIGFWFKKESANVASMRAFLVNRVGDLGFLLGIALVLMYTTSLDYNTVFGHIPNISATSQDVPLYPTGPEVDVVTLMCVLFFIGAMGKSAQIPLHVWLEGSMEGPTPISALIHAATMVTAGVYMVARLSPMFEYSDFALNLVLIIGSATCFFMGLIALVQFDIKRVVAYSTLSQLGYMIAAEGASAFSFSLFHLMTHAGFKALLFLAAGSVILGMHHEQDMRKMGGLRKYMPVTYVCFLIGSLSLVALPPFAGFYSKDLIIKAIENSDLAGSGIASFFVVGGALLTSLYTFRMFFMTFHGKPRMDDHTKAHLKESSISVLIPLVVLAIPSFAAGFMFFDPIMHDFFKADLLVLPQNDMISVFAKHYSSPWDFLVKSMSGLPLILALIGIIIAWVCYIAAPNLPKFIISKFNWVYEVLVQKFTFDILYDVVLVNIGHILSRAFAFIGDKIIIDWFFVEGTAKSVKFMSKMVKSLQTGYIYQYTFVMLVGLIIVLCAVVFN